MRKVDNLPPSCAVVTKSGNLKFLEPSGPLLACNGTALRCVLIATVHVVALYLFFFLILKKMNGFVKPRPTFLLPYIRAGSVGSFTASQKSGERPFNHVNHHTIYSHTQGQNHNDRP